MSETAKSSETSGSTYDREDVNMMMDNILNSCIDYDRAVRYSSMPSSKFLELEEAYDEQFSGAKKYMRKETLAAEDFMAIEDFYVMFDIFHRENVELFSEEFRHYTVKGSRTLEILANLTDDNMVMGMRKSGMYWRSNLIQDLRDNLNSIMRNCVDYFQKVDKHGSNVAFATLEGTYDDFHQKAIKYKKSDLGPFVHHEAAQLCCDFGIFHWKVMKAHRAMYVN